MIRGTSVPACEGLLTWVAKVVGEVFQWADTGHDCLPRVAEHGHHSQSAQQQHSRPELAPHSPCRQAP